LEMFGTVAGGALGAPLGPMGVVGGAGLGYGISKELQELYDVTRGNKAPRQGAAQAVDPLTNVAYGTTLEAVVPKVVQTGVKAVSNIASKIKNVKGDTYLAAIGNKGEEIINALRGKTQIVPGTAPTAGEAAAPAGSVGFSTLQAQMRQVPGTADTYAAQEAQNIAARQAQETRVQDRAQGVIEKLTAKINRGLSSVAPEESGRALSVIAEAEKQRLKKGVIEPAYKQAFDSAGDAKINVGNVIDEAETILGRKLSTFDPSTAPATVTKLLSLQPKAAEAAPVGKGLISGKMTKAAPKAAPPDVTLQQLDDVRKAINADIAAAKTSNDPAAATTLRNLGRLHKQIDDAVNNSSALTDETKTAYRAALDLYRTEYVPRFKTGINANMFQKTAGNEGKIKPEDVVKKYFNPNGVSEAEQFLDMYGKNPDALRIARSGIEDLYLREAGEAITPKAHAAFLRKYADPIRVMDGAGVNVTQRLNVVAQDAARLARVQEIAKASGNKLAPPLPAGSNALAVEKRIADLTRNLSSRQLADVNAVRQDLLREGEYQRLVSAGAGSGLSGKRLASGALEASGGTAPQLLNRYVAIFNNVVKRLSLKMDDKLALEIARELTSPVKAAEAIEQAMKLDAVRKAGAGQIAPTQIGIGIGRETGLESRRQSQNMLAE
jgi:hypothetical protein